MEFAFIEDDDALRAAIENPSFAAWRIFLHPEQRVFTTQNFNGPARITGGAGTGKTVVLLHRARALQRKNPQARIVLTTYNRTLADSLKAQLQLLDPSIPLAAELGEPGVYIAGVDAIAYQVIASAGDLGGTDGKPGPVVDVLGPRTSRILDRTRDDEWRVAAEENAGDLPAELRATSFLEAEYATVVLPERITTEQDYLKVRRPGRGVSLNRPRRKGVWGIIAAYRASTAAAATTDYEERAAIATRILEDSTPPADHVLVDEGQDLSPARFQLLRALAAPGTNDLFIAEDGHQRIYGQRIVLKHFGINIVGRAKRLTLNYRTTEQNLRYALGILSGADFADLAGESESSEHYRSARSGPTPQVEPVKSLAAEYDLIAEHVSTWLEKKVDPESIGLLVTTKKEGQELARSLGERGVTVTFVDRDSAGKRNVPQVMTMHRSKGMEFAKVVLVGVSATNLPRNYIVDALPEGDRDAALQRERSLLYVAATRARDELIVVWVGEPSKLLPSTATPD
nr:3'-5' exonuclease [Rhodococcus sp. HNM0563]